eukprot:CAMPEP_0181253316 /NCGR_PEP_ID=MMETSP1096-20121128/47950_1 /TAXON_ID=156174 ORGANISM="Chrysochromulina ericina, Strain CCMP281" /NCGR_SAMPLE_ID=MMETSP1096 /ASSEMBLY_ACC=CAM_ASM_000453 /LENGTH=110 /DNA_ID=CAMNT_0023351167 /DNA_START=198 /DNA_END=530 /DNA_ORIENTATION=-
MAPVKGGALIEWRRVLPHIAIRDIAIRRGKTHPRARMRQRPGRRPLANLSLRPRMPSEDAQRHLRRLIATPRHQLCDRPSESSSISLLGNPKAGLVTDVQCVCGHAATVL